MSAESLPVGKGKFVDFEFGTGDVVYVRFTNGAVSKGIVHRRFYSSASFTLGEAPKIEYAVEFDGEQTGGGKFKQVQCFHDANEAFA